MGKVHFGLIKGGASAPPSAFARRQRAALWCLSCIAVGNRDHVFCKLTNPEIRLYGQLNTARFAVMPCA
jgi:hypothetical protein